jgi:serine/threonine-protein kinase
MGRYTVVSHLASGGTSELYIARQEAVGGFEKNLVLKLLQTRYEEHPRVVRMFLEEARLSAKLNHPSIVHVYDVAESEGHTYIAMEYIDGETLTDIIRRAVEVGRFPPMEHVLHIVGQVAAGLDYAHRRHEPDGGVLRIVHRDVSPSNIMVSYEGQAKIIDFGIARVQDQIREESGMHPGKPSYMSPEQVAGAAVDCRSDIFSLGIILFETTLAQRLWRGPAEEVKRRILNEPIPPPTSIRRDYPPALERIVMRALEKRPQDRYQSAEEMHSDLEDLAAQPAFRSGARRVALYLRGLFPARAALSSEGIVERRPARDGDSIPLPLVSAAAPAPSLAPSAAPTPTPMPTSMVLAPRNSPGGPLSRPTPASAPVMRMSVLTTVQTGKPKAPLEPAIPDPRGPSNAKLALGAAIVTAVLIAVVLLFGRSRRPETVLATPTPTGAGTSRPGNPAADLSAPPSVAAAAPAGASPSATAPSPALSAGPGRPGAPPAAAAVAVPEAAGTRAAPLRGATLISDRARNRRQRRPMSMTEPIGRSGSPTDGATPSGSGASTASASEPLRPVSSTTAAADLGGGALAEARAAAFAAPAAGSAAYPARAPASPQVAAPPPPGFIDTKAVTVVVRSHATEVQACFDRALMEHAELHGRLTLRATVDSGGRVLSVSPMNAIPGGGRLQTCVMGAFERWTFPRPTQGAKGIVTYSFSFE